MPQDPSKTRAYYLANRERLLAKQRAYYEAHREERLAYWAEYRAQHPEQVQASMAAWHEANAAYVREQNNTYNAEHREKRRTYAAHYRVDHREAVRAKSVVWHATNKDKPQYRERRRAYRAAYRAKHPDKYRQYVRDNPDKMRAISARRRAHKKAAPRNDFTAAQWRAMKVAYSYRCVYCGVKPPRLEMDHIQPLSKGGSHTLANIVPSCRPCNSRKNAGPVLVPVQPLLLL